MSNPFSSAWNWYKQHVPHPITTAALGAAGIAGATRLGYTPMMNTLRSLGRPLGTKLLALSANGELNEKGELTPNEAIKRNQEWDETIDELQTNKAFRRYIPLAMGLLGGGTLLYGISDKNRLGHRLWDWNAPQVAYDPASRLFKKTGALVDSPNYTQDLDWNETISLPTAQGLFNEDPRVAENSYVRNLGGSIVNNAALTQGTRNPTLGGIFDSAIDKINTKLTVQGVVSTGVKAVVSNGAARLFTSALGTMCNISPEARQNLVDAGTWAGTITAILD